jgi:large subunit ribosomal protein L2
VALKKFNPITPSLRFKTVSDFSELTTCQPLKKLTQGKKRISGRGAKGRISVRARGGGHKRRYRLIDFKRSKRNVEGKIVSIEYDPNRTARIALINYKDGDKRYILAPIGIKIGDNIIAGENVKPVIGNAMPLKSIPIGSTIHNLEMYIGRGGQLVRSAGTQAQLVARENEYCTVKLPSGEVRLIHKECYATLGQLSNVEHSNITIGNAGRKRYLGKKPKVRGVAMNPVDHPHGGGEGKSSGGRHPCTPWGKPTKGYKTRSKKKLSSKFIISRRKVKRK